MAEGASTYVEDVAVSAQPVPRSGARRGEPVGAGQPRSARAARAVADDPFRAVQVLPGVATGDDFRAEFAVRGLGPSNIGIAIDGVDSPLLFHTVRGVQDTGSLGLINSDILESATLLAGPHPQRLDSHLGSRLDFTTRDGSRERLTVRGLVSASAASTVWEGPLGTEQERELAGGGPQELHRLAAATDRFDHRHRRSASPTRRASSRSTCRRGRRCACR